MPSRVFQIALFGATAHINLRRLKAFTPGGAFFWGHLWRAKSAGQNSVIFVLDMFRNIFCLVASKIQPRHVDGAKMMPRLHPD